MGSVKIDIHKAEHQFHRITFSDTDCIKGLIRFRSKLDPYLGVEQNRNENEASEVCDLNQELICVYIDLDNLIKEANLNRKQMDLLNKIMMGWTEDDIAEAWGVTERAVKQQLDTIVAEIKKVNDLKWKYDYMYLNFLRVPWNYKTCNKCGVTKPATNDFFSKNKTSKDGFHSICKKCR